MCLGVGAAMVLMISILGTYYNVIMAYTLYYMFASWQSVLPWSKCDPSWATPTCYERSGNTSIPPPCTDNTSGNKQTCTNITYQSSAEQYWE